MATPAQIEANRRNAKKSTGPRTAAGKAISSRNATTLGLFSRHLLQPGEDPAELQALHDAIMGEYRPATTLERLYADRIVAAAWRLQRALAAEDVDGKFDVDPASTLSPISNAFTLEFTRVRAGILERRISALERSMERATSHLLRLQKVRRDLLRDPETRNGEIEPNFSGDVDRPGECIVLDTPPFDDTAPLNIPILQNEANLPPGSAQNAAGQAGDGHPVHRWPAQGHDHRNDPPTHARC